MSKNQSELLRLRNHLDPRKNQYFGRILQKTDKLRLVFEKKEHSSNESKKTEKSLPKISHEHKSKKILIKIGQKQNCSLKINKKPNCLSNHLQEKQQKKIEEKQVKNQNNQTHYVQIERTRVSSQYKVSNPNFNEHNYLYIQEGFDKIIKEPSNITPSEACSLLRLPSLFNIPLPEKVLTLTSLNVSITVQPKQKKLRLTYQIFTYVKQFKNMNKKQFVTQKPVIKQPPPSEKQVLYLEDHLLHLKEEIKAKSNLNNQLIQKLKEIEEKLLKKSSELADIERHVKQNNITVQECHRLQNERQNYLLEQPSGLLRIQVNQYKKCEQELFDLADFLNVTHIDKVEMWIGQTIKKSDENHNLFLKELCDRKYNKKDNCTINREQMEFLWNKIQDSHQEMIANFDKVLNQRIQRIRQFINIMTKLAINTVAKRQYLDEINNNLPKVELQFLALITKIEESIGVLGNFQQMDSIRQYLTCARQMGQKIFQLYKKAQIFY